MPHHRWEDIKAQYRAIHGEPTPEQLEQARRDLEDELAAWAAAHPDDEHTG